VTEAVQIDLDARRHDDDVGDRQMRIAVLPFVAQLVDVTGVAMAA
jgi:hypothetical protein